MALPILQYQRIYNPNQQLSSSGGNNSERQPLLKRITKRKSSLSSFSTTLDPIPEYDIDQYRKGELERQRRRHQQSLQYISKQEKKPKNKNSFTLFCNIALLLLTIFSNVAFLISTPIYIGSVGDGYIGFLIAAFWFQVIFFGQAFFVKLFIHTEMSMKPEIGWWNIFLVAVAISINAILLVFTTEPNRTAPYLQAILQTFIIPFTVVVRYLLIGKAINKRQAFCIVALIISVFVSLEPKLQIMQQEDFANNESLHSSLSLLSSSSSSSSPPLTSSTKWYFPFIYTLSYLPTALAFTLIEKHHTLEKANTIVYISWVQLFLFLVFILFVWVDFLPNFGTAESISKFLSTLKNKLLCIYIKDELSCNSLAKKFVAFILSYCFTNMFNLLLIKYADGAIYAALSTSLVTPLATLFWTFFNSDFSWRPTFDYSTTPFIIVALIIMMPSAFLFSFFSNDSTDSTVLSTSGGSGFNNHQTNRTNRKTNINKSYCGRKTMKRINSSPELYKTLL